MSEYVGLCDSCGLSTLVENQRVVCVECGGLLCVTCREKECGERQCCAKEAARMAALPWYEQVLEMVRRKSKFPGGGLSPDGEVLEMMTRSPVKWSEVTPAPPQEKSDGR